MDRARPGSIVYLLLGIASVFVIVWGIRFSAVVLNPILLATVITIVVLPMPQALTKRGLPGWLSFVLTLLLVAGSLAAVVLLIFLSFSTPGEDFSAQLSALVTSLIPGAGIANVIASMVGSVARLIAQLFMVMLIFFFMLSAAMMAPSLNHLDSNVASAMSQVTRLTQDVRRYISIMTGINFLVGLGNVILLWIVGVPSAALWGLLSFVTGYIPTVGFWIALIPPVVIAYTSIGLETAVIVFLGYVLINGSVQNIIQPRMMGQGLGISPVVVFISLFVWSWLLGGIGAILSVPLTMIIMALLNNFESTRWIAVLMSAPRSEKAEDHQNARDRFQRLWTQTKQSFRGQPDGTEST